MLRNIVIKIYIVKVKSNATRSEHEVFRKFRTGCLPLGQRDDTFVALRAARRMYRRAALAPDNF